MTLMFDDESFHESPPKFEFDLKFKEFEQTDHLNDESFDENHIVRTPSEQDEFDKAIRKN